MVRNNLTQGGRPNHGFLTLLKNHRVFFAVEESGVTGDGPAAGAGRPAAAGRILLPAPGETGALFRGTVVFP